MRTKSSETLAGRIVAVTTSRHLFLKYGFPNSEITNLYIFEINNHGFLGRFRGIRLRPATE